jgi:serine phosphatase RsbU (regulator of sigma subunit)
VGNLRNRPAAEIVEAVHKAVFDFAQGAPQFDDITVVVARKL